MAEAIRDRWACANNDLRHGGSEEGGLQITIWLILSMIMVQASIALGIGRIACSECENESNVWCSFNNGEPRDSIFSSHGSLQKSFPINAGLANLSSLLLFSRTTGSLDSSSCARPGLPCIFGTSRPTLLLYLCGILTVNGSPLPARRVCPAPVKDGFVRVCDAGTGFFLTTGDANFSGAGTLCSSEKCFSELRLMSSHPKGSGAAGGGENGLITGERPTCTSIGEATLLRGILTSCALCRYFAATGLSNDLADAMPFGCLTGSFGPTGVRGVRGVLR